MPKTIEENFRDWESNVFGFGYGTGEEHTLAALKAFLVAVGSDPKRPHGYDYRVLEGAVTPTVAWLLINILCHANIIDYGSSPRFGFLSPQGVALKEFVDARTVEQLENICCDHTEDYVGCFKDGCNCDPKGFQPRGCPNPFWECREMKIKEKA